MTHIGIDLDNTVIDYHTLFYTCAKNLHFIKKTQRKSKNAVKDALLKKKNGQYEWTMVQGIVYSTYISKAKLQNGFKSFLNLCKKHDIQCTIISHKSIFPKVGKAINLHTKARQFLKSKGIYLPVYFARTRKQKLDLIKKLNCNLFIDDLPDVLHDSRFPKKALGIHYCPTNTWKQTFSLVHDGPNSTLFKIKTDSKTSYAIKIFKKKDHDMFDSLSNEWKTLRFFEKENIQNVPIPILKNKDNHFTIYRFIEGKKPVKHSISKKSVYQLSAFLIRLHALCAHPASYTLPLAKESCFTIGEYIKNVDSRLSRVYRTAPHSSLFTLLYDFLDTDFSPFYEKIKRFVRQQSIKYALPEDPIARPFLTLSPSDFGFHNCLTYKNSLSFVDFEYFGWDDPAKMISDALLHPQGKIPPLFQPYFYKIMMKEFAKDKQLELRLPLVYLLLACKWCLIILNIWTRSGAEQNQKKCMGQLRKAQKQLRMVQDIFSRKKFPLNSYASTA